MTPFATQHASASPRPTDSPFLLAMMIASRRTGDHVLERLARTWLAEMGIHVTFGREFDTLHGIRTLADREGAPT